ncbi:dTDP-4-dehydrorhamnose reductase family protein [Crenothrix polyspora]|uniref:dTDP-4-dehydrorhamnose reductase n=1 Tax=Crenothrix polyspora TaxID=360316 RepID=A0A1R4HDS0_9GAMM|nr:SDR family oxidoreductase [Crenothrix polyspora]SJM94030.1 UDP-2-acetamido-2,6-dideoxy-beta-L-mannose 4-dehydrogenase [Crenothrix polyspora]
MKNNINPEKILVLGASGMLGNTMVRVLNEQKKFIVFSTVRSENIKKYFPIEFSQRIISGVDIENNDSLVNIFRIVRPDIVINCIGVVKQLANSYDQLLTISINSLLPHRLLRLCEISRARLIHISTDCVFSGNIGNYIEQDLSDANDLYGRSKYLGEINDQAHVVTLRTSIIGHELNTQRGLVEWFLSQQIKVKGFKKVIFSGLPAVVLAEIIRDIVIPNKSLKGLYHVAAKPISKLDLLQLIADIYSKKIQIIPDDSLVIDRSLNAERFLKATGYVSPEWPELIKIMHDYYQLQENNVQR